MEKYGIFLHGGGEGDRTPVQKQSPIQTSTGERLFESADRGGLVDHTVVVRKPRRYIPFLSTA